MVQLTIKKHFFRHDANDSINIFSIKFKQWNTLLDVTYTKSRRRLIIHLPVNMLISIHVNADFISVYD